MSDLTTRQWQLYAYLKEQYSDDKYITKEEISNALGYKFDKDKQRNGVDIEFDINAINESDRIQKIIVSNHKGYKIGTMDQANEYLRKRFIKYSKGFKLTWKLVKKYKLHKQMRFTFGKERDTVEAFMTTLQTMEGEGNND